MRSLASSIELNRQAIRIASFSILGGVLALLVFAASALRNERPRPLLIGQENGAGIFVADGFFVHTPDFKMVFMPRNIIDAVRVKENLVHHTDGDRFVRVKGGLRSLPFTPAQFMAIPVLGADADHQTSLFDERARIALRCLQSGAEMRLLDAPSEAWFLSVVHVPGNWCSGQVEIVASSSNDGLSVGFGTPLEVSRLFYLLNGRLGSIASTILALTLFAFLTLPFIVFPAASILTRLGVAALYPSIAGYALFMLGWFGHNVLALGFAALVFFLAPLGIALARKIKWNAPWQVDIFVPFSIGGLALGLILLAPRLLLPIGGGIWFPGYAFFPASWSTDNLLSIMAAKSVWLLGAGHPEFLGFWSLADRGVVQAGQFLAVLSLPAIGESLSQTQLGVETLQIFGGFIQGLIIPCLVVLLTRVVKTGAPPLAAAVFLATTPFLMFNSFYIWPKLSAALLFLASLIALWRALRFGEAAVFAFAVLAFAFSTLNHSASVLAFPSLVLYLVIALAVGHHRFDEFTRILRKGGLWGLACVVTAIGLTALVQSMDPKTSWPITYMLTGEGVFGLDQAGINRVARAYFANLSIAQLLALKTKQVVDLIWVQDSFFARAHQGFSFLDTWRSREMFSAIPAMGPGFLILILGRFFPRPAAGGPAPDEWPADLGRSLKIFALACLINLVFFVALFQMQMVVHQIPYGLFVGAMTGTIIWARASRRTMRIALALQVLNLIVVWYFGAANFWSIELPLRLP